MGTFGGDDVWQIYFFRAFGDKMFGEWIDQPKHYYTPVIVNTNLNSFSLANHGWFTKYAKPPSIKLSC